VLINSRICGFKHSSNTDPYQLLPISTNDESFGQSEHLGSSYHVIQDEDSIQQNSSLANNFVPVSISPRIISETSSQRTRRRLILTVNNLFRTILVKLTWI